MNSRHAFLFALALAVPATTAWAQSDPPAGSAGKPPSIVTPPLPSPAPPPPAATPRPEPGADFCCTPYGRFGPVGNAGGRPGMPCQWTLPSSVAQGSTCP